MSNNAAGGRRGFSRWLWLALISIPLFFLFRWLFWWLLCPSHERISAVEIETPREVPGGKPVVEDDLTRIKGIGPKMSQALRTSGIRNFRQLALARDAELESILREAQAPFVNASGWQEQAKLAAQGAWEELEALQKEL